MFGSSPQPSGGSDNNKENKQFATAIAGAAAFLLGPVLHRYTVDWVIRIAEQTYPPEVMVAVDWLWLGFTHVLLFLAIRAPVFAALTVATVYFGARFAH